MNSKILLALFPLLLLSLFVSLKFSDSELIKDVKDVPVTEEKEEREDKRLFLEARALQEFEMTKDPATGDVPRERLIAAWKYKEQLLKDKPYAPIAGVNWTERGPNNVPGRTRAIMVDPNDVTHNTVFAGGVAGGLWKTTNFKSATPSWTPVNDFFTNLAITTLVTDPANTQNMYFGTGEGYFNSDAVRGDGIWKSTDGGTSWSQLASTSSNQDFHFVQKIVVNATGTIFAATRGSFCNRGGIMRSVDGGTTWTKVLSGNSGGFCGGAGSWAADVEIALNGDVYAAMGISYGDGVYKSTDNGATWTQVYAAGASEQRIELAVAPGNPLVVYGLVEGASNQISRIMNTLNAGISWNTLSNVSWADQCAAPVTDFTRGQAFYDLAIAVDPFNANRVYIGGVDVFVTNDAGVTWTQVTEWANCSAREDIHADQHAIVYAAAHSDTIIFTNDGGIYVTENGSSGSPNFTAKGTDYNTTQFYACAMHPTAYTNHFLAGAQDNGSQRFSTFGMNSTVEVTGGDGAFCHIDQDEPQFQFTQYIFNNFRRSTNGGVSFSSINAGNTGQFINPSDYDDVNDRMYSAHNAGTYLRWNDPQTGNSFTSVAVGAFGTDQVSAVTVAPITANRVYFGTDGGAVVRVDNAHGAPVATDITGGSMPAGNVACIAVETANENHILVVFSNYGVSNVWETTDGGSSWTACDGNLPDMPVRWALFNPNNSSQALIATELGVWSTDLLNGGTTNWGTSNSGLANVRVDMLQYRASDGLVIAATHGRGLFSTDVFSAPHADFVADDSLIYTGTTINFSDGSFGATSWSWNFGDGSPASTLQNPSHAYAAPGLYNVTLSINSGADTEVKNGYIHVLPDEGTPYAPADGGSFELNFLDFGSKALSGTVDLWERGAPSNALVTLNTATNGWKTDLDADVTQSDYVCALYGPSHNMSAAGTYSLRFRLSMETVFCNAPFALQVQFTTDKGATWSRLGAFGDGFGTNWYNRDPGGGCAINSLVIPDREGWTTNISNSQVTYDISSLAGNTDVAFRFVFFVDTDGGWSAAGYAADGAMIDDYEITGPVNGANGLPVEMSPLAASWVDGGVMLDWKTYSEKQSAYFDIERSADGVDFQSVGQVNAAFESNTEISYDFLDQTATEDHYFYRLKQVDINGEFTFSNVAELRKGIAQTDLVTKAWPNPVKDQLNIQLGETSGGQVAVTIVDLTGKVMFRGEYEKAVGLLVLNTAVQNLPAGTYLLQVTDNNSRFVKKFLKM